MWRFVLFMAVTVVAVAGLTYTLSDRATIPQSLTEGPLGNEPDQQRAVAQELPSSESVTSSQATAERADEAAGSNVSRERDEQPHVTESAKNLVPATALAPFDPDAFAKDPNSYLNVIDGRRVMQTAQPSAAVPQLASMGPRRQVVPGSGHATLRIRTIPFAPVTCSACDGGLFQNRRSVMTARADADGVATFVWSPSVGTIHDARIIAASPVASGRVLFTMTVDRGGDVSAIFRQ